MPEQATVHLPEGWWDGAGTCHRTAVVRPLCGGDEEWLRDLALDTPVPRVVTDLLVRCVGDVGATRVSRELVLALAVGDRDYLVLRLWGLSLGDSLDLVLMCPRDECGARMDVRLDVASVPVKTAPPRTTATLTLVDDEGRERRFRPPTGADVEWLADSAGPAGVAALVSRCLEDAAGAVAVCGSPALQDALEAEMERVTGGVERELEAVCPECGHPFMAPFDPARGLLGDLARRAPDLDDDVHLLALNYHWPLAEILALARPRRVAYVERLLRRLDAPPGRSPAVV